MTVGKLWIFFSYFKIFPTSCEWPPTRRWNSRLGVVGALIGYWIIMKRIGVMFYYYFLTKCGRASTSRGKFLKKNRFLLFSNLLFGNYEKKFGFMFFYYFPTKCGRASTSSWEILNKTWLFLHNLQNLPNGFGKGP